MAVIIRLQNLPLVATTLDIRDFFKGLNIPEGGVHIVGGENGDTFIGFTTDEDARQAMALDNKKIKSSRVKLLLSSRSEMQKVIADARDKQGSVQQGLSTTDAPAKNNYKHDYNDLPPRSPERHAKRYSNQRSRSRDKKRRSRSNSKDRSRMRDPRLNSRSRMRSRERSNKDEKYHSNHSASNRRSQDSRKNSEKPNPMSYPWQDKKSSTFESTFLQPPPLPPFSFKGEAPVQNNKEQCFYAKIGNLPELTSFKEIKKFFAGCDIPNDGIYYLLDDNLPGRSAIIKFDSERAFHEAISKNGRKLGDNKVDITPSTRDKWLKSVSTKHVTSNNITIPVANFVQRNENDDYYAMNQPVSFNNYYSVNTLAEPPLRSFVDTPTYFASPMAVDTRLPCNLINSEVPTHFNVRKQDEPVLPQIQQEPSLFPNNYNTFPYPGENKVSEEVNYSENYGYGDNLPSFNSKNTYKGETHVPSSYAEDESFCIFLDGIPYSTINEDLIDFFHSYKIKNIYICRSKQNKASGEAFIEFLAYRDYKEALAIGKFRLGKRIVYISSIKKEKTLELIKKNIRDMKDDVPGDGELKERAEKKFICAVSIKNILYSASQADLFQLFLRQNIKAKGVYLLTQNGQNTCEAFIELVSFADLDRCLGLNAVYMGNKQVVFESATNYNLVKRHLLNFDNINWFPETYFQIPEVSPIHKKMPQNDETGYYKNNRDKEKGYQYSGNLNTGSSSVTHKPSNHIKLLISNLHSSIKADDVIALFKEYRCFANTIQMPHSQRGYPLGEAILQVPTIFLAEKAVHQMNNYNLNGKPIDVKIM